MRLRSTIIGAACAVSLCAPSVQAETIRVAISGDMRSTEFGVNRDSNTDTIMHHVVESLVGVRDNLEVGPALAKDWTISDDGTTYTFNLRDEATFHNGEPVTAEDVKWSWERMLDPETGFRCLSWYDGTGDTGIEIASIDVVDTDTVSFMLEQPNALFLNRMAHVVCLTGIIHPDSVDEDGEWQEPIGTGPYTIAEWRKNQYVELKRFDDYVPLDEPRDGYAGAREPLAEKIRFLVVADPTAMKSALLAGDVDAVPDLDLDAVEEIRSAGVDVSVNSTPGWRMLIMQNRDEILSDIKLRQAIAHAIDREAVTEVATAGLGEMNPSSVAPQSSFFGPEFEEMLEYDPEKARSLLAESDYDGEPIQLITSTVNSQINNSAIAIQSMLTQAGINARIEVLDWAAQYNNYNEGTYQMMIMGYSARPDATMAYNVLVGDKDERSNVVVGDEDIIAAVKESGNIADPEKRRAKLVQIHEMMMENSSAVHLFNSVRADAYGDGVEGYRSWTLGKPRFWGVQVSE